MTDQLTLAIVCPADWTGTGQQALQAYCLGLNSVSNCISLCTSCQHWLYILNSNEQLDIEFLTRGLGHVLDLLILFVLLNFIQQNFTPTHFMECRPLYLIQKWQLKWKITYLDKQNTGYQKKKLITEFSSSKMFFWSSINYLFEPLILFAQAVQAECKSR
jgi:hypothetical protein